MTDKKYTLITGGSSGLGKEFAIQCARMRMNVILIALSGGNAQSLAKQLISVYNVDAQAFELDMTDTLLLQQQLQLISENYKIDFLINNAGIGGTASILDTSVDAIDRIIQLNVRSTAIVTRCLIPHLLKHERSYIMNISSMAAFTPIAYKTVYPASKAFISSFSLGLREELADKGVSVSVVYPGPIMTNSSATRRIISQGVKGKMGLLPTSKIAGIALKQTLAGQTVIIPGIMNKVNHLLMNLLPLGLKLWLVSKEVRKEIQYSVPA